MLQRGHASVGMPAMGLWMWMELDSESCEVMGAIAMQR